MSPLAQTFSQFSHYNKTSPIIIENSPHPSSPSPPPPSPPQSEQNPSQNSSPPHQSIMDTFSSLPPLNSPYSTDSDTIIYTPPSPTPLPQSGRPDETQQSVPTVLPEQNENSE